jgi:hypothetical protein
VTIEVWNSCTSSWVEQQVVVGSDTANDDLFGSSVSLEGDTLLVGANYRPISGGGSGKAYVFTRSGTTWSQAQAINPPTAAGLRFGYALAQSGSTMAIGSPLAKHPSSGLTYTGIVSVYTKGPGGMWQYKAAVLPSETEVVTMDHHGTSIALDNGTMVVGAPGEYVWGNSAGAKKGKAWVFTGAGDTWTETAYLVASDGAGNDWFGKSVARSGNTIIVGAPNHDSAGTDAGAAYVFTYANGSWSQTAKLVASDAAASAWFGFTVAAVSETRVVIGAAGAGKLYSFSKSNGNWVQDAGTFTGCPANATVGYTLSVSGNLAISSKPGAFVFDLADPTTTCVGPP